MLTVGYVRHPRNDSFARGAEMDFWTLEFFSSGTVEMRTRHGLHAYDSPCVALIPPHTAYTERATQDGTWTEHFAIFDPPTHWHNWLDWPQSACHLGIINLSDPLVAEGVASALQTALNVQQSPRANRRTLVLNSLERVLLLLDEINPARGRAARDERIETVLQFIATHYHEPLRLETLAACAFLSPSRFSHLFKESIKQTPGQFLESYRLERAAEKLLQSSQPIEHISREVGFSNAFHFSTRFRRRFGQSPSAYRRSPRAAFENRE